MTESEHEPESSAVYFIALGLILALCAVAVVFFGGFW